MIIVTGGAGFIGSNLVKGLNDSGITDIVVVDSLRNSSKFKNLISLQISHYVDKYDFIDNLDHYNLAEAEIIFHMGACSDTMEDDAVYMMKNNYDYSVKLLNYAVDKKISFIYASSASTYGDGNKGFIETRSCEDPLNLYAFSKFLFDQYVRRIMPNVSSQVVGLRYFNVFGMQENHKGRMASVACHFYNQIIENGIMKLFKGSDHFLRDFIFVDDVVKINKFFYDNPDKSGIFNCGTGEAQSFLAIAKIMQSMFKSAEIEFVDFPDKLIGKYQEYTKADIANLRTAGFQDDFMKLEDSLVKYVNYLNESGGYFQYEENQ